MVEMVEINDLGLIYDPYWFEVREREKQIFISHLREKNTFLRVSNINSTVIP